MTDQLRQFKKAIKPFKQGYVATQLQITQSYLSQIMRGKRKPSEKIIRRMGDFVGKINQPDSQ